MSSAIHTIGILNITPDSINRLGRLENAEFYMSEARQLVADGAELIDVGAQATNPSALPIEAVNEWQRLEPILPWLLDAYSGRISLDTFRPEVAEKALAIGEVILNDVTMFYDPRMVELAVQHQVRCIVSHLPPAANGSVQWAHKHPDVDSDVEVLEDLLHKRREMINAGVKPQNIILDPGIGFGKTPETNRRLLEFSRFMTDRLLLRDIDPECLNEPVIKVCIGASQKRFLAKYFADDPDDPEAKNNDLANIRAFRIAKRTGAAFWRAHKPVIYKDLTH